MRIAVATVGTRGDVAPFVALGIALREAGHDVTAMSWDLWRDSFEDAGIPFEPTGPSTSDAFIAGVARDAEAAGSPLDQVKVLRDAHLRDAAAHARQLSGLLSGYDLAVIHGIHSLAQAAAQDARLPYATAVFDPVLLPTATAPPAGMPSLGPLNRGLWWMLDRMLRRLDGPLKAALNEAGMPSPELRLFRGRSPLLHLVACSPSIMAVPADLPPTTHVTGAWVDPRPPAPLPGPVEAFLAAGAPPILVSFGSMASDSAAFHAAAVTGALGKARLRAVVQGLPVTASDAILPVGAVDHRALLPRMFAALHHGGAGTTHAVVRAGRPSVVVPHVGDQPYWAMRLERLGVAPPPIASKDLSEELLAERLALATAAAMRERAARLGEAVASEAGTAAAVEAIAALNRPASGGVTDPGGPSR